MLLFSASREDDIDIARLRIALVNYIVARKRAEGFILTIEDGRSTRDGNERRKELEEILSKFAIVADQVIEQRDRVGRYQHLAVQLVESGKAFASASHSEDIASEASAKEARKGSGYEIVIAEPSSPISFEDERLGSVQIEAHEVGSFVLLEADGSPSTLFASACDNMADGVDFVIEEEKRLVDTARKIHIENSLGYTQKRRYLHLPELLVGNAPISAKKLLLDGYLPDAVINYLLLCTYRAPTRIFTMPEAVESFDSGKIYDTKRLFDIKELAEIDREHISRMDERELSRIFGFADRAIGKLAKLYLAECSTIVELERRIETVFGPAECDGEWAREMKIVGEALKEAPFFEKFEELREYIAQKYSLDVERVHMALTLLICGAEEGPQVEKVYEVIKPYIMEVARCRH
jgi:glutamyl-tRNA synthetase